MYAVVDGNNEVVSLLLEARADINAKDKNGNTALMYAARGVRNEVVTQLLEAGADINAKDNHGQTLLFTLVNSNNPQFIRRLLDAGLDPSVRDDYGKIALDYMTNYNQEIFDMLSVVDTSMQIYPERLEQLRTKLKTMNVCDYNNFTPINIVDGIYEICLDSECDYLKVYELGESSRLDQLEKELAEKQATIGNLVNSLKGILSSINKINNIVVLIDTLIAGYPNGNVHKMQQYIDSLEDTNNKRFIEQILEFFIETIDEYKDELWITLTNGLDKNELRDQGKFNFIRRLHIKLASTSKPLIEAKGRLNNYRGDFDQRKTLPDVIDSYECNYDDGKARGLIIVPKSWGYMECSNPVSLITKENWGEVENKRPIKLFIYNTELTKHDKIMCFNYDNLMKSIETRDKFLNWVPRDPFRQIEENTGMGGKPGKIKITKLPDGSHILEDSLNILESSHINYGLLPIYLNMRVGNTTGTFGASMAHGQNKVTVYGLFKTDENGNLLNKEEVMKYSKNVEEYSNEVKLNENINDKMLNRISASSSLADSSFTASSFADSSVTASSSSLADSSVTASSVATSSFADSSVADSSFADSSFAASSS